jgi:DNA-binding NtrC family response regulator
VDYFFRRICEETGSQPKYTDPEVMELLTDHDWPGNVRELENVIERALVTSKGRILTEEDFAFLAWDFGRIQGWSVPANLTLEEIQKQVVAATLRRTRGNVKEAATCLGIDRSTLYDWIRKYNIPRLEEGKAGEGQQ